MASRCARIVRHYLALVLALWLCAGSAMACADPPRADFRAMVGTASSIFVFQFISASYVREDLGGGAWTERVEGRIKVVESLKGDGRSFQRVIFAFRGCGSVRMSVGQFYLAATSQKAPVIELWGVDQALLDLTLDFYSEKAKESPAVDIVRQIVAGQAVPDDFPQPELEEPLRVYPVPPPPLEADTVPYSSHNPTLRAVPMVQSSTPVPGWSRHCTLEGIAIEDAGMREYLGHFASNCGAHDACLLACLRSGCAYGIGGGCYHVCSGTTAPAKSADEFEAGTSMMCKWRRGQAS